MSVTKAAIALIVLMGTLDLPLFGQDEWPLQQIDKRSGLTNSAINAVYLDRHDHVWFGTWDGLNRYDGDAIVGYKPIANDEHSLSNNIIRQILEDKAGNLWVVTHDGINRYDHKLNQFNRYLHKIDGLPFHENNLQAALTSDSVLFVSLVGWGIGKYSEQEDKFVRIKPEIDVLKNVYGLGAHEGHQYLLGNERLFTLDASGKFASQKINWTPNTSLAKLIKLDTKYFLIYQENPNTLTLNEITNGKIIAQHEINTGGATVTSISLSMDQQRLYMGTDEGKLLQLIWGKNSVHLESLNQQLSSLYEKKLKIFSIHESKQNILWVGTDGDGVYKYLTKKRSFHSIGEGDAQQGKISNSIVRSIAADQNNLYIGTRSGGLNIVNERTNSATIYDKTNGLSDNTVLAQTLDAKGNLWIGLDNEGIDMIEKKTGKIYHFPRDFSFDGKKPEFGSVYKILIDTYGHLWLGTSGYGVVYLDYQLSEQGTYILNETYSILPEHSQRFGSIQLKSNIVYSIETEGPNMLWFGSRNGGLYRFNSFLRQFTHNLRAGTSDGSALSNEDVLSLYNNRRGQLWVGTSGGLNKVNLSDYSVEQYTQNDGLANNTIHGILEDYNGSLWLSSNNGLFVFDPLNDTFKNFNWSDGLINYEYTDGAYCAALNDKRLFFGGTNGVDIVFPSRIDTVRSFPRLALTSLSIANILIQPGDSSGILHSSIDIQNEIDLNYTQNFLSFKFTTLDYWHKQRCKYRYYLEGFDSDWINLDKQSVINLTNIPPGDYTLHLNNTNENSNWNPAERTVTIRISPPYWATTTAYVIYIILAILAQFGLILLLRNRSKRKKIEEIDRLKQEQSEVIQKYKLEFFTNIAHEFRTPLTLILGPAAVLLEKTKNKAELNIPVQSIFRNSLRLQKLIHELIQFRKVELGKEKLKVRSLDLVGFMEELLQSFRQYAIDKEIKLTYETPNSLNADIDSEIVEKILINLISNALKYTDHDGAVHVRLWQDTDRINFNVKDTGVGFRSDELNRIFERFSDLNHENFSSSVNSAGIGLSLTRKLILLHQGDITVESTPGKGSEFSFWLPTNIKSIQHTIQIEEEQTLLHHMDDHVQAELDDKSTLDQEMINISLQRFDHNILIVDDNTEILNLLKGLLSPKYNVISCTKGTEALDVIFNRKIDLVVSDIIMPEMDGYTLCEAIKTKLETSHIPVILLTAKGNIEERIEGLQVGADAYIPKPFHPDHLQVRIEKLIRTREMLKNKFESYTAEETDFSSFGIGTRDDEFFTRIDQFIKDEMANPNLEAQHIASFIGVSKTSLYKKERALTGQTPQAIINR